MLRVEGALVNRERWRERPGRRARAIDPFALFSGTSIMSLDKNASACRVQELRAGIGRWGQLEASRA
jgi:hypothetical protein